MRRHAHAAGLIVMGMAAAVWGQTATPGGGAAAGFDAEAVVKQLAAGGDARKAGLEALKRVPLSGVVALIDAAGATGTPDSVREDVNNNLPGLFAGYRAAQEKADAALGKAWRQTYLVDVYKKGPNTGAAWDAAAIAALEYGKSDAKRFELLDAAVKAGCKDVLVRQLHFVRGLELRRIEFPADFREFVNYSVERRRAALPAATRFYIGIEYLHFMARFSEPQLTGRGGEMGRVLSELLLQFGEYAKSEPGHAALEDMVYELYSAGSAMAPGETIVMTTNVVPQVLKALPDSDISIRRRARLEVDKAWEARGAGTVDTVTPAGWQGFEEHLDLAEKDAIQAWRMNPLSDRACVDMMAVCIGKGYGRDKMESWFALAMAANPNSLDACLHKMNYLFPKWHGSEEEVLEFGEECAELGNAENRIPTVLLQIIEEFRRSAKDDAKFMGDPGVWQEIQLVYGKLLADKSRLTTARESYLADRGRYVRYACECGQWEAVQELMKEYGADVDVKKFGGKALYAFYQKLAAAEVAKLPAKGALPTRLP